MSETLLLLIFGTVITLLIFFGRKYLNSKRPVPVSKRLEALVRVVLTLVLALLARVIYHGMPGGWDWLSVLASGVLIYGATHLGDVALRTILKEKTP
jgi:putative effector of murein hydrolase